MKRHTRDHLPLALVKATEAAQVAEADTLLEQVQEMRRRARAYGAQAIATGDVRVGLVALREERSAAELVARLVGELRERGEGEPEVSVRYVASWGGGTDELNALHARAERAEAEVLELRRRLQLAGAVLLRGAERASGVEAPRAPLSP